MATNAKLDACQLTNPRTATLEEVIQIYKDAMLIDKHIYDVLFL